MSKEHLLPPFFVLLARCVSVYVDTYSESELKLRHGKRTFLTLYYLLFMKRTEVNIFCPNSTCTKLSSLSLCVFFLPDYFDLVSFSLMEKIPREKGRRMTTGGIKRVQIPSRLIGTRVAAY